MERNDFYPFMKVSLNGEKGVVTDQCWEVTVIDALNEANYHEFASKLYGVIRWDTNKNLDFEDWRGQWGTFVSKGGHEINPNFQFKFINDDGTFNE